MLYSVLSALFPCSDMADDSPNLCFSDKKVKDQDLVAPQEFHSFTYNVRIIPVNFKL